MDTEDVTHTVLARPTKRGELKILVSAYACRPASGSEPGAGYALMRAAATIGPCWLLTRRKHATVVRAALDASPTTHPVTVVPVDASERVLAWKQRTGNVRTYYVLWQSLARRHAIALDAAVNFDVLYHATFSTFWLPVGIGHIEKPLVVGPVSGGCTTPRSLMPFLSATTALHDTARFLSIRTAGTVRRLQWRRDPPVLLAQERETQHYLQSRVLPPDSDLQVHPHATQPDIETFPAVRRRSDEVIFAGRLLSWKGTSLALRAFAKAAVPSITLTLFGEGPDRRRLERLAHGLGVADAVRFAGLVPRDEMLRRLRAARALLFPSFHDSAGFVVSEALTLGVPVICLDHGGPGALVKFWPEAPSTAVPPMDREATIHALAQAVRDYVNNPRPIPDAPQLACRSLVETLRTAFTRAAKRQMAAGAG